MGWDGIAALVGVGEGELLQDPGGTFQAPQGRAGAWLRRYTSGAGTARCVSGAGRAKPARSRAPATRRAGAQMWGILSWTDDSRCVSGSPEGEARKTLEGHTSGSPGRALELSSGDILSWDQTARCVSLSPEGEASKTLEGHPI